MVATIGLWIPGTQKEGCGTLRFTDGSAVSAGLQTRKTRFFVRRNFCSRRTQGAKGMSMESRGIVKEYVLMESWNGFIYKELVEDAHSDEISSASASTSFIQ